MGRSKKAIALLIAVLVFNCVSVYAVDNAKGLKNGQKGVNSQKEEKRSKIKKLEKQQKNLSTEINELDKKTSEAGNELNKVEKQLVDINNNIEKTTKELKEAEEKLGKKQDTFNSRLRVMYKKGNIGYIEVLLSAANIKDFLAKKEMVQAVVDHDVDLLEYMKEQREIIEKKGKELQTQKVTAEVTRRKIESKKNELMVATRSKQSLMKKVETDKVVLEKQLDELERESRQITAQVSKQQGSATSTGSNSSAGNISVVPSGGAMTWPSNGPVTSPYGPRWGRIHSGVDIGVPVGTSVAAAKDGVVILAKTGYNGGYGNYLVVDHGGGVSTLYAHNSSLSVGVGTRVRRGQQIALSGNTGRSTGPHVHFEVRINGSHVNPMPYLR
ncbi:MAG: peptidoglycan DD-metalloendopeptidase family protein [Clostridiaceae bacterium]|nr:peptidoglycan DD-metalloendopeptidase family protein [Clostridiaceae bacterium]MBW4868937.1 peptidoglycan DD-metalloendopeptidase family protein [Clostridiaceae bacterium]